MTKQCIICGKEFKPRNCKQLCCSKECSKQNTKNHYQKNKTMLVNKQKEYNKIHKEHIKSYQKIYNEKFKVYHTKICPICNKEFITTKSKQ